MPETLLCPDCRALHLSDRPLPPHRALRPILDLGGQWLFRCSCCQAFATAPLAQSGWSFNVLGSPLEPVSQA